MTKIAIIDLETTGLDYRTHEIIEIGCVILDTRTHEVIDTFEAKIKPERIEDADAGALRVNGYTKKEWQDAITLRAAMIWLARIIDTETLFCAHNMIFDWAFLEEAQRKTGVVLGFDRHKIDLLTLAWSRIPHSKMQSWSLKTICTYLRIPPEPKMHRALNGAMAEAQVYKALMQCV